MEHAKLYIKYQPQIIVRPKTQSSLSTRHLLQRPT